MGNQKKSGPEWTDCKLVRRDGLLGAASPIRDIRYANGPSESISPVSALMVTAPILIVLATNV
jgi:hypothetical protein